MWSFIPISLRIFHSLLWFTQWKALVQSIKQKRSFSGILLLFWWSKGCWQFDLWFLCLFLIQLEHLEVHGSCTTEAWLGEFWALLCWRVSKVFSDVVVYTFFLALPFFGIGMKTDLLKSCGHCWVFQICWHIECSTFTASPFRIWNSSAGIPSPPLVLFILMLAKAHLTSHSRMSGSRWMITPSWLSWSWRSFSYSSSVFLPPLLDIFCFC